MEGSNPGCDAEGGGDREAEVKAAVVAESCSLVLGQSPRSNQIICIHFRQRKHDHNKMDQSQLRKSPIEPLILLIHLEIHPCLLIILICHHFAFSLDFLSALLNLLGLLRPLISSMHRETDSFKLCTCRLWRFRRDRQITDLIKSLSLQRAFSVGLRLFWDVLKAGLFYESVIFLVIINK